jgi:hypothetical protein
VENAPPARVYHLYSTEFVRDSSKRYRQQSHRPTCFVEFISLDELNNPVGGRPPQPLRTEQTLHGHVYMDSDLGCNFGPFVIPKDAAGNVLKVKSGAHELGLTFFESDYLKLSIPKKVLRGSGIAPGGGSDSFEFWGIKRNDEKIRQQREKAREIAREKARQEAREKATKPSPPSPPSPRETFFERVHRDGYWAEHGH